MARHKHGKLTFTSTVISKTVVEKLALEQILQQQIIETTFHVRDILLEKWKKVDGKQESFKCNIFLDLLHDPVVMLCSHLYWPCIYGWI